MTDFRATHPLPEGVPIRFDEEVPLVRYIDGKRVVVGSATIDGHIEDLLRITAHVTDPEILSEFTSEGSYSIGFRPGRAETDGDCDYRPFEATYFPPPKMIGDD